MSLFEKCFKSWFDTVRWWEMSCAFEIFRNYWFRCFLRRVMVIFRQQKNFGPNVRYCVFGYQEKHFTKHKPWFMFVNCSYIVSFVVKSPSRGKNPWKQHLRIQEGHFLKIALNLDLTLSDDGECPALLISCGIIDLGVFCVELWSFFASKRISVPI